MARIFGTLLSGTLLQLWFSFVAPAPVIAQTILDEARRVGRDAASFTPADEDWFHDMDGGITLSPEAVRGRNAWLVCTGGNDRAWDELTRLTYGSFDAAQDHILSPRSKVQPQQPLQLFRFIKRAMFRWTDWHGSSALWFVAGQETARMPSRPIRK